MRYGLNTSTATPTLRDAAAGKNRDARIATALGKPSRAQGVRRVTTRGRQHDKTTEMSQEPHRNVAGAAVESQGARGNGRQ